MKLQLRKRPEYWNLYDCTMAPDGYMKAKMEAKEFDAKAKDHDQIVTIIDGKQFMYLASPCFNIMIERCEAKKEAGVNAR